MKSPLKEIVRLGLLHLCLASTYTSFNTLVTYIHSEMGHKNLGPLILIFGAISTIFFNLIIPNLNIKMKGLLLMYGCAMTTNYLLNFASYYIKNNLIVTLVILIGTVVSGFGVAIIGIVSGKYISVLCKQHNKQKEQGKYYGIYGAITQSSFLVGSFISVTTLSLFTRSQYYLCLATIALVSTIYCLFFIQDIQNDQVKSGESFSVDNYSKKESLVKFGKTCIFSTLRAYKKMASLFPIQLAYGLMSGFIVHCLSDLIFLPQPDRKQFFLTISIVFLGVGAIIGVYTAGILSDKLKLNYVGKIAIISFTLGAFISIICLHYKITYLAFLTAFVWGFSILFMFNWLNVICSRIFNGTIESFAANRQICTISFIIFQIYISIVPSKDMKNFMYYELTAFVLIAFIGWATMDQKLLSIKPIAKKGNSQIELDEVQMEISDRKSNINSQELHRQIHQSDQHRVNQNQENKTSGQLDEYQMMSSGKYQMMSSAKFDQKQFSGDIQQIGVQEDQNIGSCGDVNKQ